MICDCNTFIVFGLRCGKQRCNFHGYARAWVSADLIIVWRKLKLVPARFHNKALVNNSLLSAPFACASRLLTCNCSHRWNCKKAIVSNLEFFIQARRSVFRQWTANEMESEFFSIIKKLWYFTENYAIFYLWILISVSSG